MVSDEDSVKVQRLPDILWEPIASASSATAAASSGDAPAAADDGEVDIDGDDDIEPESDNDDHVEVEDAEFPYTPETVRKGWSLYFARDNVAQRPYTKWTKRLEEMRIRHAFHGITLKYAQTRQSVEARLETQKMWKDRKRVQILKKDRDGAAMAAAETATDKPSDDSSLNMGEKFH